jgi:Stigma-specific protein, Stig1
MSCPTGQQICSGACVDPKIDPTHCGACDKTCAAGEVCSQGACALQCGGGTTKCGSLCINTQNDPSNCGACDKACAGGEVCSQSACALTCSGGSTKCGASCINTQNDPANCGDCGKACAGGEVCAKGACALSCSGGATKCGNACVSTKVDPANCGDCGTACAMGEVCSNGACGLSCVGGSTKCGSACVDTAKDPTNCGTCGTACAMGEVCSNGACGLSCVGGSAKCGSVCVDTAGDPANCGTCGTACAMGEVCSNGACGLSCVGGSTKCGSTCVDTKLDPGNCGTCGTACPAGQVCANGACGLSCGSGTTQCGSTCVVTATDTKNCGTCGTTCASTQACSGGACTCAAGQTTCGNACVNLSDNSLNCGGCGNACAAGEVCGAGACVATTPGNGGTGGSLTGLNPPKVAVFGAASTFDLQTKLTATGAFSQVDFVDVNSTTPTLAAMKAYDAVVVYTYFSVTQAFGDNLAGYFEAGGGVVLCDYESQEIGTYALKGRFATDYTLSTQTAKAAFLSTKVTLGALLEPTSPLLNGVTTFGIQSTSPYHLPTAQFNKPNTFIVAQYSDMSPAVVRGTVTTPGGAPRNLVEINSFGMSSNGNSTYGWDAITDGAKLFRNALLFTIPPKAISMGKAVAFGNQPISTPTAPQTVTYTNASAVAQTITALSITGTHISEFSVTPSAPLPVTLPAGGTFTAAVTFTPGSVGLRAARLNATVQGVSTPATTLLSGNGT